MNGTGIREQVIREICDIAEKYMVENVILIGSRARGDFHRARDIYLAVKVGDFTNFFLDVDEETSTLLRFDFVDLNQSIQQELRESIEREGKIIYEKI